MQVHERAALLQANDGYAEQQKEMEEIRIPLDNARETDQRQEMGRPCISQGIPK